MLPYPITVDGASKLKMYGTQAQSERKLHDQ